MTETKVMDVRHITPKPKFLKGKGIVVTFFVNESLKQVLLGTVLLKDKHSCALTPDEMKIAWDYFIENNLDTATLPEPYNEIFAVYKYSKYNTWHCTLTSPTDPWSIRLENRISQ